MTSKKLQLLMLGCLVSPAILQAQSLKENYIQWQNNKGDKLFRSVEAWQNRGKVTEGSSKLERNKRQAFGGLGSF